MIAAICCAFHSRSFSAFVMPTRASSFPSRGLDEQQRSSHCRGSKVSEFPRWSSLEVSNARGRCLSGRQRKSGSTCAGRWRHSEAKKLEPLFRVAAQMSSETTVADRIKQQTGRQAGAVFFDLDDTLVLTHKADAAAHSAVMELLAVRAPHLDGPAVIRDFLKGFKSKAWDPENKVDVTEWRARLWAAALKGQGVDNMYLARDMQNCFDKERMLKFCWTSNVELLVRTLHSQGIKVGIITNGHPKVQREKLKACRAEELFDTIVVGGEEPKEKPHQDIFVKACQLAGCKPDEAIMVGDSLQADIQGGINAGFLATVWVNLHKKEEGLLCAAKPDIEIGNFSELQQVLEMFGVVLDTSE